MPEKTQREKFARIGQWAMQLLVDAVMINLAMLAAMYLKFDMEVPMSELGRFSRLWPIMTVICIGAFYFSHMYQSLWQYASVDEALQVVLGTLVGMGGTFAFCLIAYSIKPWPNYFLITSKTVYPIAWVVMMLLVGAQRFSVRLVRSLGVKRHAAPKDNRRRVLVVGAGWAGSSAIREMVARGYRDGMPVLVVDDDKSKAGTHLGRVPVLYGIANIPAYAKQYAIDDIVIAIPSASQNELKAIMDACTATECKLKLVPGLRDVTDGRLQLGAMRDVNITDLLYRDEIRLDMASISGYLEDKIVMVTGGGGSIGSELCRQIVPFRPKELVIFDIYENNAYELANELKLKYGDGLRLRVLIGSVRDVKRLEDVFAAVKPQVVFHAAAHKHVPLMEDSPAEAVKNNVFGTLNVARCADKFGVGRFVLLSTDKAVNPTNVMGATKRVTEMIIQYMATRSETRFMAVRFGNVLGSNGSVIPLFRHQIEAGGPVTVTDPDITRYFMTIPEASQLVLQAGAIGESGNVFVLDMGTPVKIVDLARNLIRLSGYKPDEDIKIVFSGLRPGEKLYEELMMASEKESMHTTHHAKIFILRPEELDPERFGVLLEEMRAVALDDPENVRLALMKIVPTFRPGEKRLAG